MGRLLRTLDTTEPYRSAVCLRCGTSRGSCKLRLAALHFALLYRAYTLKRGTRRIGMACPCGAFSYAKRADVPHWILLTRGVKDPVRSG